jgi:hypothetical protein
VNERDRKFAQFGRLFEGLRFFAIVTGRLGATVTVIMRLPAILAAAIDAWAGKAGITRSEAMRQLVEHGLRSKMAKR